MSLIDLDARVEALRTHQLPEYVDHVTNASMVSDGWPRTSGWRKHIEEHGLPPVVVTIPLPSGHPMTISWVPKYSRTRPATVVRTLNAGGCTGFWAETRPLNISKIDHNAVIKTLAPIIDAAPTPSAAVRAVVEHIAALCDAEAARWTTYSAALRAKVAP